MTARITVVEQVYCQSDEGSDISMPSSFSYRSSSDAQVWQRTKTVGEEWEQLERGWITSPSLLLLRNEGGAARTTKPTADEREEDATRAIELGVLLDGDDPLVISTIPHGQSARIPMPIRPSLLWVRCRNKSSRYTVHMVP